MTRLRKLKKLEKQETIMINKTASTMMDLDSEMLNSGDVIGITVRVVNWKPWYQVYIEYGSGTSSFFDGPESDKAFSIYKDLLLAFKGVKVAESFNKQIPIYEKNIESLVSSPKNKAMDDYYHNLTLKRPSFLGYY